MTMNAIVSLILVLMAVSISLAADASGQPELLAEPAVKKIAGGFHFIEGPVWTNDDGGFLVFSDIPADETKKWTEKRSVVTFRKPSFNTNGNTRDREGRLISCETSAKARRITRTESDGSITILADNFDGKKFNATNDVVVKSDGTIWFTDPTYDMPKGTQEIPGQYVFQLDPQTKRVTAMAKDFDQPNGLCFSPDEKMLYIADSGHPHHIRVFNVQHDGTLNDGRIFCVIDNGVPDGIRCDEHGNVWSSAGDGVQVFSPDGMLILRIKVPETPANLCFGGATGKTLFITARTSLYAIQTNVRGAARP